MYFTEGCNPNVALNKPTYASSIYPEPPGKTEPSTVVDGSWSDSLSETGCFITKHKDMTPWWIVDLLDEYIIHNVTIQNRNVYSECNSIYYILSSRIVRNISNNRVTIYPYIATQ